MYNPAAPFLLKRKETNEKNNQKKNRTVFGVPHSQQCIAVSSLGLFWEVKHKSKRFGLY